MKTASRFLTLVSIGLLTASSASAQLADEFEAWLQRPDPAVLLPL